MYPLTNAIHKNVVFINNERFNGSILLCFFFTFKQFFVSCLINTYGNRVKAGFYFFFFLVTKQ